MFLVYSRRRRRKILTSHSVHSKSFQRRVSPGNQLRWYWQPSESRFDWIEQGLTSPPTQYRLVIRETVLQVKRPNQQQSTEGKVGQPQYGRGSKPTRRLPPCYKWTSKKEKTLSQWVEPSETQQAESRQVDRERVCVVFEMVRVLSRWSGMSECASIYVPTNLTRGMYIWPWLVIVIVMAGAGLYRVQLAACVSSMIKSDYPDKWPGIAEKIVTNLESDKHNTWLGSLICLYQLVKNFE